ncbi:hypothetical protein [Terriglobus aquaticus]|uniref:Uncharacterized protein n=1 Tax=Terriglobus aquaticus TaxID=940139 RepID=A0ABW9KIC5_9BACT|nr:hypothetical protein [Terriglobus aquaticus]
MEATGGTPARRPRLTVDDGFAPWIRAEQGVGDVTLLWLPVAAFPMSHGEKAWLFTFLTRLHKALAEKHGLREEIFLQFKALDQFGDEFRRYVNTCMIRVGIGRAGDEPFSGMPPREEVQRYVDERTSFDYKDWMADYLVWFVGKDASGQRERFGGFGGMLTVLMQPDAQIRAPKFSVTPAMRNALPVFSRFDVDGLLKSSASLQDSFQARSKAMFGAGLEDTPEYPGIPFIMPLLKSAQFFLADEQKRNQWFTLFDLYVTESVVDKGVLLAFQKTEYERVLLDVLETMRADTRYPSVTR